MHHNSKCRQEMLLTPVLYIFTIIGIKSDLTWLHLIEKDSIISLVRNKLEDHFKDN